MGMSEIQRKLRYISMGAEQYESARKREFRKDYVNRYCNNMRIDQRRVKAEDPEYYEMILADAEQATNRMWDEELRLIAKWKEQDKKIRESVRMAGTML